MSLRAERYETLRVIASGGMATVHLGRALGAGGFERLVAIKIMHPHLASEPEFVAMFLDEARLAARIRHPNVVSTLDVQADDEGVFLVMEYVEGPSLQQVFRALGKSGAQLPLEIFFRIFIDTLAGLHAAHELRDAADRPLHLVHRDVSPQNILIGADGITRITDFGVASAEARLSSTHGGQLKGKLGYMSPEQSRSEPVDRRTDIYAAGVILWEVLAGGRRFRGGSESTLLKVLAEGTVRSLREVSPLVPEALEVCCMKALAPRAQDRHATAAELSEVLEEAVTSSGLRVASARAVAAFVTELRAHERPVDLPAAPPQSVRASLLLSSSQRRSLPGAEGPSEASLPQTTPDLRASVSDTSQPSTSAALLVSGASIRPSVRPAGQSRKVLVGVGVAALAGLLAVLFFARCESGGSSAAGLPAAQASSRADALPSSTATATASATAAVPSASPSPTEAPPVAVASSSVVVAPSSSPAPAAVPTAAGSVRPAAAPGRAVSPRPTGGDRPPATSPVYRPPDL